jgi:hypothetical protein
MEKSTYSRRKFIGKCLGPATAFLGGAIILSSCKSKTTENNQENNGKPESASCDDLSGVSKSEIEKREKFGYVKESTVPGSHCGNCSLYIPPEQGQHCGKCLLFKGPVRPTGYCTQYVAKDQSSS